MNAEQQGRCANSVSWSVGETGSYQRPVRFPADAPFLQNKRNVDDRSTGRYLLDRPFAWIDPSPQVHMVGLMSGQMNSGRRFMKSHRTAFIGMPGAAQGEVMP